MSGVVKCDRCRRRMRRMDGWNATLSKGVIVGYLCPDCQTLEQNVEAEIHEATLDYGQNALGRLVAAAKGGAS